MVTESGVVDYISIVIIIIIIIISRQEHPLFSELPVLFIYWFSYLLIDLLILIEVNQT